MRYRKKPVVIEAVELTWENWSEICDFADVGELEDGKPQGTDKHMDDSPLPNGGPGLLIPTLEGLHLALPGAFVIKGVEGELYPCKPGIFEATYEKVTGIDLDVEMGEIKVT